MLFSSIDEFEILYPTINNPLFKSRFVKEILYWHITYIHQNSPIKNFNFEIITDIYIKFNITIIFKGKEEILKFEIKDNNILFDIIPEIRQFIDLKYIISVKGFIQHILYIITKENQNYMQDIQKQNIEKQKILDEHKIYIAKLKDEALDFVKLNVSDHNSQSHIMINILAKEYEFYLLHKNELDYEIKLKKLLNWVINYKNFSFELLILPTIHPIMPPIINFGKIYCDASLLIKIIEHPYIQNWNPYHSLFILVKNIILVIYNGTQYIYKFF